MIFFPLLHFILLFKSSKFNKFLNFLRNISRQYNHFLFPLDTLLLLKFQFRSGIQLPLGHLKNDLIGDLLLKETLQILINFGKLVRLLGVILPNLQGRVRLQFGEGVILRIELLRSPVSGRLCQLTGVIRPLLLVIHHQKEIELPFQLVEPIKLVGMRVRGVCNVSHLVYVFP